MSEKKHIKSGSVFELKLDGDSGYGYVKMTFSRDVDTATTYIDTESGKGMAVRPLGLFIHKIYNVFSPTPMKAKDFDASRFETDDILCFPPLMYWRPKLKGQGSWRFLGASNLTEEDRVIPDYIERGADLHKDRELKAFIEERGSVSYLGGLRLPPKKSTSFDAVKHLGFYPDYILNPEIVGFLTLHWRKEQGKDNNGFNDTYPGKHLFVRDNEAFRKMEKIKRLKCREDKVYWS